MNEIKLTTNPSLLSVKESLSLPSTIIDDKQNSSTPDVPSSKSSDGKGKGHKPRHNKKNKRGKTKIEIDNIVYQQY